MRVSSGVRTLSYLLPRVKGRSGRDTVLNRDGVGSGAVTYGTYVTSSNARGMLWPPSQDIRARNLQQRLHCMPTARRAFFLPFLLTDTAPPAISPLLTQEDLSSQAWCRSGKAGPFGLTEARGRRAVSGPCAEAVHEVLDMHFGMQAQGLT